jgi:hypothetical protein
MQLEEMKELWSQLNAEVEKQKIITHTLVTGIARSRYRHKLNTIFVPEAAGALVCLALLVYTLINVQQLTPWYLLVCGITSIITLLLLCIASITGMRALRAVNVAGQNCKQVLAAYAHGKQRFVLMQRISFYLSAVLLVACMPVMGKLMAGKDFFKQTSLWVFYAIAFPVFYGLAHWVFKKYKKIVTDAEGVLKDLGGQE